jgi:hypothetical protein
MCGGTLTAMARFALARGNGAHCPSTARHAALQEHIFSVMFVFSAEIRNKGETGTQLSRHAVKTQNYTFSLAEKSVNPPVV